MNISSLIQRIAGNYETRSTTNDTNAIKAPLKSVKIGDELKVQILHIGEDSSIVRLEDGSEISIAGRLPEDATEGTFLNILITDKGEGVPLKAEVLGTVKLAEDLEAQINKILKELEIPNTKDNYNLVIEMSKNNIPINKDTVSKAYEYVNTMDTSTENIMFLMKNDVEVSTTSVRAFDSMLSKSDFLETNLKVLIDTLTESINELNESISMNTMSSESDAGTKFIIGEKTVQEIITNTNGELQKVQTSGETISNENVNSLNNQIQKTEVINNINTLQSDTTQNIQTVNLEQAVTNNDVRQQSVEVNVENNNVKMQESNAQNVEMKFETNQVLKDEISNAKVISKNPETLDVPKDSTPINEIAESIRVTPETLEKSKTENTQISKSVEVTITKDAAVIKEEQVLTNENEINLTENLKPLSPIEQKEKLEKLRDEVVGLFREVKNSKELGEEISQKRIYKSFKDVILDIENSKEIFTKKTTETLTKEVTRMKENISLVSDLNKYNTIVHIPLVINDNKSLAELYVFNGDKESSSKKINENNATMFLSLGTANMGQIESYIKIVNKTIECNFMSESKIGVDVINSNKDHLAKLLDVYGYTLIKAGADVYNGKSLNIFEAIEKNKKDEAKKGFDARA